MEVKFLSKGTSCYVVFQRPSFWVWTLQHWFQNQVWKGFQANVFGKSKNIIAQKISSAFLTPNQQYNALGQLDLVWDVYCRNWTSSMFKPLLKMQWQKKVSVCSPFYAILIASQQLVEQLDMHFACTITHVYCLRIWFQANACQQYQAIGVWAECTVVYT